MKSKILITILFSLCIFSGCSEFGKVTNLQNNSNLTTNNANDEPITYEDEIKTVKKDNLKTLNDTVIVDDISYKITTISVGKELGNHKKEDVNYLTDNVDEDGNLLGDYRFIWLNITVQNTSASEKEVSINSNSFFTIADDGVISETDAEAVYISPTEDGRRIEESFRCLLKPNEERQLEIGYIIDKTTVTETLYYGMGSSGSDIENVNNKFINVEEYWNEK